MKKILFIVVIGMVFSSVNAEKLSFSASSNYFQPVILDSNLEKTRELQLEEMIISSWVDDNWENFIKIAYAYEDDLVSEAIVYIWTGTAWTYDYIELMTYDENDNILEILIQTRDSGNWINWLRFNYTYNTNNDTMEELIQEWISNQWLNDLRTIYTYNEDLFLIEELHQFWNSDEWNNDHRYLNSHDENGNIIESIMEIWNVSVWVSDIRMLREYDGNDNLIESLGQVYFMEEWMNDTLHNFTYDENNNLTHSILFSWFEEEWQNELQNEFTYDDDNNILNRLSQRWIADEWINEQLIEYFYENVSIGNSLSASSQVNISNYPNPFNPATAGAGRSPTTTFKFFIPQEANVKLTIFNVRGQRIKTLIDDHVSSGERKIVWDGKNEIGQNIRSSVYFYKLIVDGEVKAVNKMLLLK